MAFSIRRMFSNLFLSVVIEGSECLFYGRVFKNGKVVKTLNAKFSDINQEDIDTRLIEYIKRQEDENYAVYISLFYNENFQGALPTLRHDEFKRYNIKDSDIVSIATNDKFSIYADAIGVAKARDTFGTYSIDLLFSPIALLYYELLKRGISPKTTLYLYNHQESCAIAIFSGGKLQFATFYRVEKQDIAKVAENFKSENISDIEDLIIKEEEESTSLDDFKSLDELFGSPKQKDEFQDLGYDINMPASSDVAASVTLFGRDMNMFKYITSAVKEFYNNPLYDDAFLEQVIVFDNAKTSATFLQYLQTELFVETAVYPVNTLEIMNEIMTQEIAI